MKRRIYWIVGIVIAAAIAVGLYFLLSGSDTPLDLSGTGDDKDYIYVEGLVGNIQRLNPLLEHLNPADRDVNRLIFNGLVKFDQWGNPVADLAEAWNVNLNGDVFNVTLKEGILWHDGMPFTTEDIAFTIELLKNADIPTPEDIAALWDEVEVVVYDELNMQFILPEPYIPFADYLAFGVLPAHVLEGRSVDEIINGDFNFSPIGTGPYKFADLITSSNDITGIKLKQNEEYFGDSGAIKFINFLYFADHVSAFAAYQNGEILGISSISSDIFDETIADPDLNLYSAICPELRIVVFNLDRDSAPYLTDPVLRQALYYGLNRDNMIGEVLGGQAVKATGPISPNSWAYYSNVEKYEFDPISAADMLDQNGYLLSGENGSIREKDGLSISFDLVYQDTEEYETIALMIKEYWGELGVEVNLLAVDRESLINDYLDPRDYDAALIELSLGSTADPDPYPFWHQVEANSGQNYSNWDNRRGSEYLERARVTPNRQERIRQYRNFQIHFNVELPALPLYYPVYSYAVVEEVDGISIGTVFTSSDRFKNISEWYWDLTPTEDPTPTVESEE